MRTESQLEKRPAIPLRPRPAALPHWVACALIALATLAPAQLTWLHGLAAHHHVAACDHHHHHDHDDKPQQSPDDCLVCTQLLALAANVTPPPPASAFAPLPLVTRALALSALAHDSTPIRARRARGPPAPASDAPTV